MEKRDEVDADGSCTEMEATEARVEVGGVGSVSARSSGGTGEVSSRCYVDGVHLVCPGVYACHRESL